MKPPLTSSDNRPFSIRELDGIFKVDGYMPLTKERIRRQFSDRAEAEAFCKEKNDEADKLMTGSGSLRTVATRIPPELLGDIETSLTLIAGRWPILDVVKAGITAMSKEGARVELAPLAEEWLELIEIEATDRWASDLRHRVRGFLKTNPGITAAELETAMVRKWLDEFQGSVTTKRNYRGALHKWGGWLVERGVLKANPFSGIRISRTATKQSDEGDPLPSVLLPIQAEALMRAALTDRCRPVLGWFSLCMFGGLRPLAEAPRRVWPEISFETAEISVMGRKKGAKLRIFEASPQLLAWLRIAKEDGAETPGYYSRRLVTAARDWANAWLSAKGEPSIVWDEDILRHTYASMQCAAGVNVKDLSVQMGTGERTIYAHYRHPRPAAELKTFRTIIPSRLLAPNL